MISLGIISSQGISVTPIEPEWIVNMNFSRTGTTSDNASKWNAIRFPVNGETYIENPTSYNFPNLLDEDGNNVGMGFNIVSSVTNPGIGETPVPGQNFPIPQIYLRDFWQEGRTTTSMVWRLSGLDQTKKYDLRFSPYVDPDARAVFSVDGGLTWTTVASNFPTTTSFDDPNYVSINDVTPNSSGEILINVMSGSASIWFDVLAMRVRKQADGPPPIPPATFRAVQKSTNPSPYGFYEFLPENYDNQSSLPLLIFLHGSDERGNGNSELNKVLLWGPPKMADLGTFDENMIMLAPQWLGANDDGYYAYEDLADFIQYAKNTYKVDEERIYLNGISAGNWLGMYYLGNLTTSHGIAAMVITSGTLDTGYTDASFVAPSNCPMWWISNIDDPAVPWDNTKPPVGQYVPVITAVSQINAITPNMVEKLTGFDDNSHTDTWDGIYDGSLIGTADPTYDPFDETIYDWLLDHTYTPPIPAEGFRILTIDIVGLSEDTEILVNDEIQPNNQMLFPVNTQVDNITPTAEGYVFDPVFQNVTMDEDKTITFTVTEE